MIKFNFQRNSGLAHKQFKKKGISENIYVHYIYTKFGLVSLFNGISTFVDYLMPKPSL